MYHHCLKVLVDSNVLLIVISRIAVNLSAEIVGIEEYYYFCAAQLLLFVINTTKNQKPKFK